MKGRDHSTLALMTLIIIFLFLVLFRKTSVYGLSSNLNILFWILSPIFVFLGSLSPDSDSVNCKSTIYYVSLPFAYLMKISEIVVAILTGHKIKHRGVLHKPVGIIITSVIVFFLIYFVTFLSGVSNLYFPIYLSLVFMLSQCLHIFQDYLYNRFKIFSPIIYFLIALIIVFILVWLKIV